LWKSCGGRKSSWNCGVRASRGVGILLYDIDATVKEISSDDFGRILSCELKYENKTTNVYCQNDSGVRKTFIIDIDPYVTDGSLTEKMHILTGNFNCVLDKEIDRYPSRNYDDTDDTGAKELKTIMTKNILTDIWREKNPSVKKYTF